jgi:phospholipid/cholesterol/gamma-HCH transport system substrate-binding protein
MNTQKLELKVGLFVLAGLILTLSAILTLGGSTNIFTNSNRYTVAISEADGLYEGAKVVLAGLNVGSVSKIDIDTQTKDVVATLTVNRKYERFIRKGSEVEIRTQGVLGDKYLSISIGPDAAEQLATGATLPNRPTGNLSAVLGKSDQLMTNLTSISGSLDRVLRRFEEESSRSGGFFRNLNTTATNLASASAKLSSELDDANFKKSVKSLNQILDKINNGTGTLGALVNDPGLYDDAKSLLGGANRSRIVRNLVRKTVKDGDKDSDSDEAAPKK